MVSQVSVFRLPGERRNSSAFDLGVTRRHGGTASGVPVDADRAQRHSAVWSSLAAISEAHLALPLQEIVRQGDDVVRRDPPEWMWEPSPGMSWETWIWQQSWALAQLGRCYAYVTTRDDLGFPTTLTPVADDRVEWKRAPGAPEWTVCLDREPVLLWPRGPLWHVGLYTRAGQPEGMSPIKHHAEVIGVGIAAQKFGAQFFGDGAHPTGIFTPLKDPGPGGAAAFKAKIMEVLSGSREPILVPAGTKFERWQINPDESQFLDTMRYSGEEVARIFGVNPGKIGYSTSGSNVTYSNVSQANEDWRTSGLLRYTAMFESALSRLLPDGQRRILRFNFDAFLRSSLSDRMAAYKTSAEIGALAGTPIFTVNEMRREEGRAGIEGGDVFVRAGASTEAEQATILQKLYLAVNKVITTDEARDIARAAGLELPDDYDFGMSTAPDVPVVQMLAGR